MKPGSFTFTRFSAPAANGIILLILLVFFIDYFVDLSTPLSILIFLLGLTATCILVLRYKQLLLFSLAFLIPVSIPIGIAGGASISVPSELICVLLTGFFLVKLVAGARPDAKFLKHPITLLILLDLAWIFISSLFSQLPDVSFKRFVIRLCYYVSFYYFYRALFGQDVRNLKKIFTLHVLGLLVPIAYAMAAHARLGFTTVGSQQISAPFYFDHTIYGACLVFFIPFLFFSSFGKAPAKEKWLYRALLFIFTVAAILSYSRAAWLSLLLGLCMAAVLHYKIKTSYLLCVAGLVVLLLALNQQKIATFLKENKEISHSNDVTMHIKSISNVNTDASNKERINRWKCALRMFADKPLTGFGPGTYQFFYGRYQQREDLTRISTFNGSKGHAHSEYLNYLSETGLPGLAIFLVLIITVLKKSRRLVLQRQNPEYRRMALYVFTGLVTFFIHAFFNGFLEFDKMAMPVFSSFAALCALDLKQQVS